MAALTHEFRLLMLIFLVLFGYTHGSNAAEQKYAVSQKTFKVLQESRELLDKSSFSVALAKLNNLLPAIKDNRYETALVHQHLAYVYLEQGDLGKALIALENTLRNADTLPPETVQNLRYNLAQAAAQIERFGKAEEALEQWFAMEKKPNADAWYLRGLIQYRRNQLNRASDYLQKAIAMSYHEQWTVLLLSIYLEQKKYARATELLRQLVSYFPGKVEYWRNLTDVYLIREDYSKALATLQLARHRLDLDEKDLVKLARLYLHVNSPYNAAQLLSQSIKTRQIKSTADNLELLANSWAAARVPDKELQYLSRAAKMKKDGNLYLRCAQLLLRKEHWREAIGMLDTALAKGLKKPGHTYLLKGIAAYQAGMMKTAAQAFKQAGRYQKIREQAQQWLSQVQASQSRS